MSTLFYTLIPAAALLFGYILGRAVSQFKHSFDEFEDECKDFDEHLDN